MEHTGSSSNLNAKPVSAKKRGTVIPPFAKNLKDITDTPTSAASMNHLPTPNMKDALNIKDGMASARERDPPQISSSAAAASGGNNIKVICRIRPINQKEIDLGNSVCVEFPDKQNIVVKVSNQGESGEKGPATQKFAFDRVFDMSSTQEEVFYFGAKAVVESVLEGFNGTIFAYGQTSAGKTHTMQGKIDDPNLKGIIPRMVTAVFQHIEESPEHIEFTVKISIVEIYMEKIRDLISPEKNNLKVREDKGRGIYIEDMTEASVASEAEVYGIMRVGNSNRAICATNMNEGSSRSHLVFIMSIHQKNTLEFTAKTGKLYMIDLAGSEKVGKTGAAGQTLQEAKDINKSLSVLGNVINALTDGKNGHIPYRDSKLTRILQESLGGNSKTTLIIACSPSSFNDQETLSTLRFGYRAKSIKNKAKVNKEMTVAELQVLLDKAEKNLAEKDAKIKQLQEALVNKENGIDVDLSPSALMSGETKEKSNTDNASPTRKLSMDSGDGDSEKEDEVSPLKPRSPVLNGDQEERIKQLEADLQSERHSVRVQTERVNELKNHHAKLTEKIIITERENEKLIYKVSSMILKVNSLEEAIQEHETQRQSFEALQAKLLAENDELRKAKRALTKQLAEKDEEISRIHRLTSFFNLDKKEAPQPVVAGTEEPVSTAATATTSTVPSDKARKELAFKINEVSKKWISEVTQKVKIAEADLFQELASAYRQKLKKIILTSNVSGGGADSGAQELKKKIAQFEEELEQEKKKNSELLAQNESLNEEYTKALKDGIPNLEEITNKAITKVLEEEKAKFEREKRIMAKELERRVEKTTRVEMDLEKEREKNSKIEETMMENERISDLKMENLENRLREVAFMIRNLEPDSSRRVTVSERKPKDKSERISNIERGLIEAQEMVIDYKKELAEGKEFGSEMSNNISMDRLNLVKKELQQDLEKDDELLDEFSVKKSLTFADPRIVKKIRGGNRKTVGTTQDFLKLLKSPGTEASEEKSNLGLSHVATPLRKGSEKPIEEIP